MFFVEEAILNIFVKQIKIEKHLEVLPSYQGHSGWLMSQKKLLLINPVINVIYQ